MIKFGHISDIDPDKCLVRVQFDDDKFLSPWMPVSVPDSSGNKYFHTPDQGAHVWCIMDEFCNTGVVAGCIYDQDNLPEGPGKDITNIKFKDGALVQYDRENSVMTVTIQDTTLVIDGKTGIITGKVKNTELDLEDAGFTVKTASESLKTIISDLLDGILALTVTTPVGPSGTPINAVTFTLIKTRLSNLFKG